MQTITQSDIKVFLNVYKKQQIKHFLQRERLKLSMKSISFYLWCIVEHSSGRRFSHVYQEYHNEKQEIDIKYNTFMQNISLVSKLMPHIFVTINKLLGIKASTLLNIVDTSLLPVKKSKYIKQKDYNDNKVTSRPATSVDIKGKTVGVKEKTCGYKGLFFMNRKKQIYKCSVLSINESDQNILKDSANYCLGLKGFLLADKGFNCDKVKQRIHTTTAGRAQIIAPRNKQSAKSNKNNDPKKVVYPFNSIKHQKLYLRRWSIETCFKTLKDKYNEFKLDLSGVKNINMIKAKFYLSLIKYNIAMK